MVDDNRKLRCWVCKIEESNFYRDKHGLLYCEACYWKDKNRHSYETYENSEIYKNCPHCGAGDLCAITWCKNKCNCGIYHPESSSDNCPTCKKTKRELLNADINDCFAKLANIGQKEKENLTAEDWQELKKLQVKARAFAENKSWLKDDLSGKAAWIEASIDWLQKSLEEMEAIFPEELKIENKSSSSKRKKNKPKLTIRQPLCWKDKNRERERERERAFFILDPI